jgi:hypothetical protein
MRLMPQINKSGTTSALGFKYDNQTTATTQLKKYQTR